MLNSFDVRESFNVSIRKAGKLEDKLKNLNQIMNYEENYEPREFSILDGRANEGIILVE